MILSLIYSSDRTCHWCGESGLTEIKMPRMPVHYQPNGKVFYRLGPNDICLDCLKELNKEINDLLKGDKNG